jgi:hypothetical protein
LNAASPVISRNVDAVTNPSTGIYCITPSAAAGIDTQTDPVHVTVEWGNSSGSLLAAFWYRAAEECGYPAGGNLEVRTYDFSGALSDDVAFIVSVF